MPQRPESFEVRAATHDDIESVHAIYAEPSTAMHMGFDPCDETAFREIYETLLVETDLRVACAGGRVLGAFGVSRKHWRLAHVAELSSVAVAEEARGSGLARAMIGDVIDELRRDGVARVQLTVSSDNGRGLAFWEALGFAREGLHRAYFTRAGREGYFDEVSMARLIQDA